MYQTTVLDNGLKIVTAHMPGMQSLSLGFWVKTGGRYETKESAGISHFLEHMLFEDTTNRPSRELKQAIEGVGGSLNGFTGEESTCYFVKILSKHLDLSVDILSDMILNAALSNASIKKERSVIMEEIKMYMDLPGHFVADLLNELVWPDHPLGMLLTGTVDTVSSITREDLTGYKERFYTPNNMVIAAAGPLNHETVLESCKRYFAELSKKTVVHFKEVSGKQNSPRSNLHYKATEQMHIAMGVPAISAVDPDRFAIGLLHVMLGANMSSRLFEEIREKRGLAYEISTSVKKYKDTGCFTVSAGIKNENLNEAIEVILKELKKMKSQPVSAAELKRAKEFYIGQLLMALEDTTDHMLWIGEQVVLLDEILTSADIIKGIEKVTADDTMRVADKFFKSDKLNLAVIGPVQDKDREKLTKILEIL